MRSAYVEAQGAEPECTNHCFASRFDEPFSETLDYMFLSEHVAVDSVVHVPTRAELGEWLPTADQPSDHMLVGARLSIHE